MQLRWTRLDGKNGHIAAMELLAQMVGVLPEIGKTPQGKPYFLDSDLHFSISHTKNHAFCAVSHRNVGIDAEEIGRRVNVQALLPMLSETEYLAVSASADPADAFLRIWVQKECYAKRTGRGMGHYLKDTRFDPSDVQIMDGCYVAIQEDEKNVV